MKKSMEGTWFGVYTLSRWSMEKAPGQVPPKARDGYVKKGDPWKV